MLKTIMAKQETELVKFSKAASQFWVFHYFGSVKLFLKEEMCDDESWNHIGNAEQTKTNTQNKNNNKTITNIGLILSPSFF